MHNIFLTIYIPRFSNLERDYAHQENMENEQLAAFVVTMQLLANYLCAKENIRLLYVHIVTVKTDNISDTERKAVTR